MSVKSIISKLRGQHMGGGEAEVRKWEVSHQREVGIKTMRDKRGGNPSHILWVNHS